MCFATLGFVTGWEVGPGSQSNQSHKPAPSQLLQFSVLTSGTILGVGFACSSLLLRENRRWLWSNHSKPVGSCTAAPSWPPFSVLQTYHRHGDPRLLPPFRAAAFTLQHLPWRCEGSAGMVHGSRAPHEPGLTKEQTQRAGQSHGQWLGQAGGDWVQHTQHLETWVEMDALPAEGSFPGFAWQHKQALLHEKQLQDCPAVCWTPTSRYVPPGSCQAWASLRHDYNKSWKSKILEICSLLQSTYHLEVNTSWVCQEGKPFSMLLAKLSIILMSSK